MKGEGDVQKGLPSSVEGSTLLAGVSYPMSETPPISVLLSPSEPSNCLYFFAVCEGCRAAVCTVRYRMKRMTAIKKNAALATQTASRRMNIHFMASAKSAISSKEFTFRVAENVAGHVSSERVR
jgi:hypothetical protein